MVEKEVAFIYQQTSTSSFPARSIASLEKFPPIVQKWLLNSGTIKEAPIKKVFLKQKGSLKTSSSGKWMPFTAEQWFNISPEGDLVSNETKRYMGQGKNASLEIWHIHNSSFKIFNGIRIPNKSEVIWKLADGDFQWLQLEISEIYYSDDFDYGKK